MIGLGVLIVAGVVLVQMNTSGSSPKLSQPEADAIFQALSQVPSQDIAGNDLGGVPRPVSSTRSFYRISGRVTAVIYSRHGGYDEVKGDIQKRLPESGWNATKDVPVGGAPTRGASWVQVYNRGTDFLQVFLLTDRDVVATYYILQHAAG